MFSSVYFAVLPLLGALVRGYADPGRCTGACNVRDPGLVQREDGMYFLFSTHDKIKYASAKSLSGPWTMVGSVVPDGSKIDLSGRNDLWAPDVHKVGKRYHVYYSVSTLGSQTSAIGLATSDSMKLGSWEDHGSIGLESDPSKPYNAIDANLFEEGGSILMNFGSYWHNIFQTTMNDEGTKITSDPHNIAYEPEDNHRVEGGYLYQHGLFYYLFFSHGIAGHYAENRPPKGEEYKIKVCRSLLPTGHFTGPEGTPCTEGGGMVVLESHGEVYGPGGQGVFTDSKWGPVMYYHYTNTSIGFSNSQQRFGWNPLDFSSGWPVV